MEGTPTVALLHAFPFTAAMWRPQVEALAGGWDVVTPALPALPDMDAIADAVATGLRPSAPVVLGGLSMGGYVTMAILRRHPELVRAVVLADTRDGADTPEVSARRSQQQAQVGAEGPGPVVEGALQSLPSAHTREFKPTVMDELRAIASQVTGDWIVAALEAMKNRPDSTDLLPEVRVPVLVVVGEEDQSAPIDVAQAMARRLPNARLAVIPKAGHLSNLEDAEAFNAELQSFLESLA